MKKLSKIYIGAILDMMGCFYMHRNKYLHFKIRTNDENQKKILNKAVDVLKEESIDVGIYKLKTHSLYQISNRKSIDNLKKFMKKNCEIKRIK